MTESRVDAVARAIDPLAWDELDKLDEAIIPSERLLSRINASKQTANRALEASDAWLKVRGWKAVPRETNQAMDTAADVFPEGSVIHWNVSWAIMYDAAPSPEGPDR